MAEAILSAGLITDAIRAAGLEGDGRASPDSSVGIYPAATNVVPNPNASTNTTGWAAVNSVLTRVTSGWTKFEGTAFELAASGSGDFYMLSNPAFAPAGMPPIPDGPWAYSVWTYATGTVVGKTLRLFLLFNGGAHLYEFFQRDIVLEAGEQRHHLLIPGLAQTDRTTVTVYAQVIGGAATDVLRLGGFMVTSGDTVPVPYTKTTRAAGRVRIPIAYLTAKQGFFALKLRPRWGTGIPTGRVYAASWYESDTARIDVCWEDGRWRARRSSSLGEEEAAIYGVTAEDHTVVIVGRWSPVGTSVSKRGEKFRAADTTVLSDDFSAAHDPGWGSPDVGDAWAINGAGAGNAEVSGGLAKVVPDGTVYGYQILDTPPVRMSAEVVFQAGDPQGTVGILASSSPTSNIEAMTHFIPARDGWAFQVTETTPAFLETLLSGTYAPALVGDGVTPYRFTTVKDGDTMYLELPDGARRSVVDPRIDTLHGPWISYELLGGGGLLSPMFASAEAQIPVGPEETSGAFIPSISAGLVDLGSRGGVDGHFCGDVLWFVVGGGTLTDDEVAVLGGLTGDPGEWDTPADARVLAWWDASSDEVVIGEGAVPIGGSVYGSALYGVSSYGAGVVSGVGRGRGVVSVTADLWRANAYGTKLERLNGLLAGGGSGLIRHSVDAEPKTTLSLAVSRRAGLAPWRDWLIPTITVRWTDGTVSSRDFGHFQIVPGPHEHSPSDTVDAIEAMDGTGRLKLATYKNGHSFAAGLTYTECAIAVAVSAGWSEDRIVIPAGDLVLPSKVVFRPGQDKLGAMNRFLIDGGYLSATADLDGFLVSRPVTALEDEEPRVVYGPDDLVAEPVREDPDMTRFCNVVTVRRIQTGKPTIYATVTNADAGSPSSTINLGDPDLGVRVEIPRVIDDTEVPDSDTALLLARRILAEGQTFYDRLTFRTIPSTDLGMHDVVGMEVSNPVAVVATGRYYRQGWEVGFQANSATIAQVIGRVQEWRS